MTTYAHPATDPTKRTGIPDPVDDFMNAQNQRYFRSVATVREKERQKEQEEQEQSARHKLL